MVRPTIIYRSTYCAVEQNKLQEIVSLSLVITSNESQQSFGESLKRRHGDFLFTRAVSGNWEKELREDRIGRRNEQLI